MARLLTHVVEERLHRNLSRGYRPKAATLTRGRGRIDMLETTTRRLMDRGRIACRFEEHTMDTPRNRLFRVRNVIVAGYHIGMANLDNR